jgi:hypothetical protein
MLSRIRCAGLLIFFSTRIANVRWHTLATATCRPVEVMKNLV